MTSVREQSGYFQAGDQDQRLYGTLYVPDGAVPHAGVLFLPPFGEEWKCSYRHLVRTARGLAQNGYGAFRFDLSGTGESTGSHANASFSLWQQESVAAFDVMVREIPATQTWALLGARLGANLAVRLAAERQAASVILMEPLLTGQDYLRDLLRRQLIKGVMGGGASAVPESPAEDVWKAGHAADLGGFQVGPELAEELTQLRPECRVQLLRFSGGKEFPPGWQPVLERARGVDKSDVRIVHEKPFWGQLEYYETDSLLDNVLRFLDMDHDSDTAATCGLTGTAASTANAHRNGS